MGKGKADKTETPAAPLPSPSSPPPAISELRDSLKNAKADKETKKQKKSKETKKEPPLDAVKSIQDVGRSAKDKRRTRIPDRPNITTNLWTIIKGCVGRDLSKIPMPVTFSEPLSMLQRLAENFQYSELLDKAAQTQETNTQMLYVAAYTVSCYANVSKRLTKPFNPLLGETYELDRTDDMGWKLIAEQVSHHPPVSAVVCEGKGWKAWQSFRMSSKFRGQIIQANQTNTMHLAFDSGVHYTWKGPMTIVHNIILGKLWADQEGISVITNHNDGTRCSLEYSPSTSATAADGKKVVGFIANKEGVKLKLLEGKWDYQLAARDAPEAKDILKNFNENLQVIWMSRPDTDGNNKYYNFSVFACQLNEPEKGVAPTDSRRRPDQRAMEEGNFDDANKIKLSLEEFQRSKRRPSYQGRAYEPLWFSAELDVLTNEEVYKFNGKYWEAKKARNWSNCPEIYKYEI